MLQNLLPSLCGCCTCCAPISVQCHGIKKLFFAQYQPAMMLLLCHIIYHHQQFCCHYYCVEQVASSAPYTPKQNKQKRKLFVARAHSRIIPYILVELFFLLLFMLLFLCSAHISVWWRAEEMLFSWCCNIFLSFTFITMLRISLLKGRVSTAIA